MSSPPSSARPSPCVSAARGRAEDRALEEVSRRLATLVAESGFTAAEFAARLGTSPSRLSTYLSGKVMPSAALLVRAEGVRSTPAEGHPSDPVEIPFGTHSAQGSAELVDVAGARVEFCGAEQGNQTTVSARDHERGR